MHAREQIRKAVVTALGGLSVGANVFASRLVPVAESKLPALLVSTEGEDIAPADIHDLLERNLEVVVKAAVKAVGDYDDRLDDIAEEVEAALANETLGGLVRPMQITGHRVDFEQLDQPVGIAEMRWQTIYFTHAGTPGTTS